MLNSNDSLWARHPDQEMMWWCDRQGDFFCFFHVVPPRMLSLGFEGNPPLVWYLVRNVHTVEKTFLASQSCANVASLEGRRTRQYWFSGGFICLHCLRCLKLFRTFNRISDAYWLGGLVFLLSLARIKQVCKILLEGGIFIVKYGD